MEAFDVTLTKNTQGLGITIAGYVGDKNSGEGFQKRRLLRFKVHGDISMDCHFACSDSGFCCLRATAHAYRGLCVVMNPALRSVSASFSLLF